MAIPGLTGYEERIYLALVRYGPLSAKALHQRAAVPTNRIYDCVISLQAKGFIEIQPTKPKVYRAIAPKDVLERLKEELGRTQAELQQLFEKQKAPEKAYQVWITQGHRAALEARIADWKAARREYMAMVGKEPEVTTKELAMISREHRLALERGVKAFFLLNMEYPENIKKAERIAPYGIGIRHYPVAGFTMAVLDRESVRIELPDRVFGRLLIWIRNRAFAAAMVDYFNKCWTVATDWKRFAKK